MIAKFLWLMIQLQLIVCYLHYSNYGYKHYIFMNNNRENIIDSVVHIIVDEIYVSIDTIRAVDRIRCLFDNSIVKHLYTIMVDS